MIRGGGGSGTAENVHDTHIVDPAETNYDQASLYNTKEVLKS